MDSIVRVRWQDAWFELDDSGDRPLGWDVVTVGFLVEDGEHWIRVAAESTPSGYRAVSHIPRGSVYAVEFLERGTQWTTTSSL